MTRRRLLGWFALATVALHVAHEARAQVSYDTHRDYRFLPRFSVLNESGGFAGVDVDFRIRGTFGFATRLGETDVWPPQILAEFDDVDAWASHPILAYVLDLDETLNLSGLRGLQVFSGPHGLEVYRFRGTEGANDVAVNLNVARLGEWLYMRGATDPPCCDFFKYEIRALAHETTFADFDGDDEVGAPDLAKWAQGFGLPAVPAVTALSKGDANGDGAVDGADFLVWQSQQGEAVPTLDALDAMVDAALASAGAASFSPIPEPSSVALASLVALVVAARRRRHF